MIVKLNTTIFFKYFDNYYKEFLLQNLSRNNMFDKSPVVNSSNNFIEIETDNIVNEYKERFNLIGNLCNEFEVNGYEIDFLAMYIVSFTVKMERVFQNADVLYQRDLYSAFDAIIKVKNGEIKELEFDIHIKNQHIGSGRFTQNDIKTKIFDLVAMNFERREWDKLSTDEKVKVVSKTKQFLIATKPNRGKQKKIEKRKQFITAIEKYIIEVIPGKFKSGRQRHLFIGKLAVLYCILPEPNISLKDEKDNYLIKTIEYLLRD